MKLCVPFLNGVLRLGRLGCKSFLAACAMQLAPNLINFKAFKNI